MTGYLTAIKIVACAACIAALCFWQYHAGRVAERAVWQERESEQLRMANAKIVELQAAAREVELAKASAVAAVSADYQRRLNDANKQRAADADAIRAGTLRLRDPGATSIGTGGDRAAETPAPAGGCDGRASGELSGAAAQFLFDLAADADQVAMQLQACQAVIIEDRR